MTAPTHLEPEQWVAIQTCYRTLCCWLTCSKGWPQDRDTKPWMAIVIQNLFKRTINFDGWGNNRDQLWATGLCIMIHNNHHHQLLWSAAESRVLFSQAMDDVQNRYDSPEAIHPGWLLNEPQSKGIWPQLSKSTHTDRFGKRPKLVRTFGLVWTKLGYSYIESQSTKSTYP